MKKLVEDDNVVEEISTISDEALALLALENGIDRYIKSYVVLSTDSA
jgi:hypothetical protein